MSLPSFIFVLLCCEYRVYNMINKQRLTRRNNMLESGMKAPEFTLPDKDGNMISLSDFL